MGPTGRVCLSSSMRVSSVELSGDRAHTDNPLSTVFSGLRRLSYLSASEVLGVSPDIAVYAKILSGGLLPLSTTLASGSIFKAFLHPTKKVEALLHGHSYTANPIACNVSLTALKMVEEQQVASEKGEGAWKEAKASWLSESSKPNEMWSLWDKDFIDRVSKSDRVQGVMTMGTVVAIELKEEAQDGFGGTLPSGTDLNSRTLT